MKKFDHNVLVWQILLRSFNKVRGFSESYHNATFSKLKKSDSLFFLQHLVLSIPNDHVIHSNLKQYKLHASHICQTLIPYFFKHLFTLSSIFYVVFKYFQHNNVATSNRIALRATNFVTRLEEDEKKEKDTFVD